jgi:hypothetical protein
MQTYQMLTRVTDFGSRHVGLFPPDSAAAELLSVLGSGAKTLSEESTVQTAAESAMRNARLARESARNELRSYVDKIGELSRSLHADSIRPRDLTTEAALIAGARAFIHSAGSLKEQFRTHALPAAFAEEVQKAVEELERATLDYSNAQGVRTGAIQKSAKAMEQITEALQRFDFIVANALEGNTAALASYATARSVGRARSRKTAGTPIEDKAAPATAASATAA